MFGKWRGEAQGKLVIEGATANGPIREVVDLGASQGTDTAALRHLWARHHCQPERPGVPGRRRRVWQGHHRVGSEVQPAHAVHRFTAVDHVVRNTAPADSTSVNQPLPLPQGVENTALGAPVPSTPEPATWGAVLLTLSVLAMLAQRRRRSQTHRYTS